MPNKSYVLMQFCSVDSPNLSSALLSSYLCLIVVPNCFGGGGSHPQAMFLLTLVDPILFSQLDA